MLKAGTNPSEDGNVADWAVIIWPLADTHIDVTGPPGAWLWPHPRGVYDHCRGIAPFAVYGPGVSGSGSGYWGWGC